MPTRSGLPYHGLEKGDTANRWLAMGGCQGLYLNQFIIKQDRACCLALRARDMVRITSLYGCLASLRAVCCLCCGRNLVPGQRCARDGANGAEDGYLCAKHAPGELG